MNEEKIEEKAPDNSVQVPLSNEEMERLRNAAMQGVIFHMNELRKLFAPHIKVTFIAHNPETQEFPAYLTDDADTENLIDSIRKVKLSPITGVAAGRA